jgi:hypothetical protein
MKMVVSSELEKRGRFIAAVYAFGKSKRKVAGSPGINAEDKERKTKAPKGRMNSTNRMLLQIANATYFHLPSRCGVCCVGFPVTTTYLYERRVNRM